MVGARLRLWELWGVRLPSLSRRPRLAKHRYSLALERYDYDFVSSSPYAAQPDSGGKAVHLYRRAYDGHMLTE